MRKFTSALILVSAFLASALAQTSPFIGKWDFNISTQYGTRACWLGISEKDGKLDIWFQPTGGNVYEVKDFSVSGSHLVLTLAPATAARPAFVWELDAKDGKLTGAQKRGAETVPLTGLPAPPLKRDPPQAWTSPEPLFDGSDLNGWEPIGNPSFSHWIVQDGLLVNQKRGDNLKTTRKFDDFKVHYEVNCPQGGNSGFYLRGRYEVQIEYEPLADNPPERRIGSVYGRIAANPELPRTPGQWDTFDVTLVGRIVTVVRNGTTIIDRKEIDGITGGALDANESEPGPFYIQGDHTGGIKFRNITVSVPKT